MTSSYHRNQSVATYNSNDYEEYGCRMHVADLSVKCTKRDIENAFDKWPLIEVWHAQASCFAFVVLRYREHGQQAISELDGRCIGDARIRVSFARPRSTRSGGSKHFDPNMRCYQCGSRGHFSRDCGTDQQRNPKMNIYEYRNRNLNVGQHMIPVSLEISDGRSHSYNQRSRSRSPRPRDNSRQLSSSLQCKSREDRSDCYTSSPRS